jgi:hypothetical protein
VCKEFKEISESPEIWKHLFQEDTSKWRLFSNGLGAPIKPASPTNAARKYFPTVFNFISKVIAEEEPEAEAPKAVVQSESNSAPISQTWKELYIQVIYEF